MITGSAMPVYRVSASANNALHTDCHSCRLTRFRPSNAPPPLSLPQSGNAMIARSHKELMTTAQWLAQHGLQEREAPSTLLHAPRPLPGFLGLRCQATTGLTFPFLSAPTTGNATENKQEPITKEFIENATPLKLQDIRDRLDGLKALYTKRSEWLMDTHDGKKVRAPNVISAFVVRSASN